MPGSSDEAQQQLFPEIDSRPDAPLEEPRQVPDCATCSGLGYVTLRTRKVVEPLFMQQLCPSCLGTCKEAGAP